MSLTRSVATIVTCAVVVAAGASDAFAVTTFSGPECPDQSVERVDSIGVVLFSSKRRVNSPTRLYSCYSVSAKRARFTDLGPWNARSRLIVDYNSTRVTWTVPNESSAIDDRLWVADTLTGKRLLRGIVASPSTAAGAPSNKGSIGGISTDSNVVAWSTSEGEVFAASFNEPPKITARADALPAPIQTQGRITRVGAWADRNPVILGNSLEVRTVGIGVGSCSKSADVGVWIDPPYALDSQLVTWSYLWKTPNDPGCTAASRNRAKS